MTRWSPDTCACVLDVMDWDAGIATTVKTCEAHTGLVDDAHLLVVHRGENMIKNQALTELQKAAPDLFLTAAQAADRNRRLVASLSGTLSERASSLLDALSDENVIVALGRLGLPAATMGQTVPGVTVDYRFEPSKDPTIPRALSLYVPALTVDEQLVVEASLSRLDPAIKVVP